MDVNHFSFGGIKSSDFQISCGTEKHSILPQKRKYTQEIIGYDGVADFGIKGYDVRVITLPIYFDGNYADLRANRDYIAAWLYNDGTAKRLVFGHTPDRYYMAKIYAAIDFDVTSDRYIGDIQFECNPPWQYLSDGTLLTPEQLIWLNCDAANNQFVKKFVADGVMRFVNQGMPVKPIIKIIGAVGSGFELTCGQQVLKINTDLCFDGFAVDCNNETITRMSDGQNMYEFIDPIKDDFFEFPTGNIELKFSPPDIREHPASVTIIVEMQVTTRG